MCNLAIFSIQKRESPKVLFPDCLPGNKKRDGITLPIRKKYDMIKSCNHIIHGYGNRKTGPNFIMTVAFSCPTSVLSSG
jgi:hypothetical protein